MKTRQPKLQKSRRLEMMEQVTRLQTQFSKNSKIQQKQSNQSRNSNITSLTNYTQITSKTHHVPLFTNERQIAKQIPKSSDAVDIPIFTIFCVFLAGILASFSGLYIGDTIAAQQTFIQPLMQVSDSQIGFLASSIFLGSLFMPLVCAPFIDKYGPVYCGIFMNVYNCVLCLPMPFLYRNYTGLLAVRLICGAFPEATFSVQSAMIVKYLPKRLESLGFGICMSVATSANLISFFIIPKIMEGKIYDPNFSDTDPINISFISNLKTTFWMNEYVSLASLVVFVLACIPLLKIDKKVKQSAKLKEETNNNMADLDQPTEDSRDDFIEENDIDTFINTQIREIKHFREQKQQFAETMKNLQPLGNKVPNNFSILFFAKKVFFLPLDYWLICVTFCLLLSCCYGAQTLIITYLNNHISYADTCGIVRSIASILGGPICGAFVSWRGQRPLLNIIFFILAICSFGGLFLSAVLPPYIPAFLIGFFDGTAATVGKSLFSYVVQSSQLNNAYAFGGIMLNVGQFAFPPVAGGLSVINFPDEAAGIIWFYIGMLLIGLFLSCIVYVRDKKYFNGVLSKIPEV